MELNRNTHLNDIKPYPMQPKHIGITEPCTASRDEMLPHEKGSFCTTCQLVVHDFSTLSNDDIKRTFRNMLDQRICGRITTQQEASLNAEFEAWSFRSTRSFQSAFLFTLIAVFGLTLFSCSDQQSRKEIRHVQETAKAILAQPEPVVKEEQPLAPTAIVVAETDTPTLIECAIGVEVEKEPIAPAEPIRISDMIDTYDGGMMYSPEYRNFLIETVQPDEYDDNGQLIPKEFSGLAFPNPAEQQTTLELKLPQSEIVVISLYDMNGQLKQTVYEGAIEHGTFRQEIDLFDLPAGTYLIHILSATYKEIVRVVKI